MNWYLKVLKQYADFSGRARRKEYWMFSLFNLIITYGIIFISIGLEMPSLSILSSIYSLAVLIPSIAVGVRRMHDAGKSGWFLLIPIYNLILACTDSEAGSNKWGANPKSDAEEIDLIGQE
ncbi:DUF805 domain-containing protein [Flavivirga rizhaonensis]|uniref:DUF805 domain-containing protein n=1 Tax=Flavivirga rizhaonensis TaxID=2559571 RepID=A0A4S1DVA6_9FLAO|nr:DUF805 domain-containing protein [Flavivirga rizhaonensis]TGV01785.1 DUF805 domain-containing protein [Flavivirga rizhaonensis]